MVKGNQQKILDAFYDLAMQNPNEANLSMSDRWHFTSSNLQTSFQ